MKSILTTIALALSLAASGFLGYREVRNREKIAALAAENARQAVLVKELALQEGISIHITNTFTSKAVLGKVVVQANVQNVAEQVASILKGELKGVRIAADTVPIKD